MINRSVEEDQGVGGAIKVSGNAKFIYAYVTNSIARGTPRVLLASVTAGQIPLVAAAPVTSAIPQRIGVTTVATGSAGAGYQWIQIEGDAYALVDGTPADVVAGNMLEVLTTATSFIQDGGSTRTVGSVGFAKEAQAANSAVLIEVYLFGDPAQIAAT